MCWSINTKRKWKIGRKDNPSNNRVLLYDSLVRHTLPPPLSLSLSVSRSVNHESYVPQELRREGIRWWWRRRRRRTGGPLGPRHRLRAGHLGVHGDSVRRGARRRPVGGRGARTDTTQQGVRLLPLDGRSRAPGVRIPDSPVSHPADRRCPRLAAGGADREAGPSAQEEFRSPRDKVGWRRRGWRRTGIGAGIGRRRTGEEETGFAAERTLGTLDPDCFETGKERGFEMGFFVFLFCVKIFLLIRLNFWKVYNRCNVSSNVDQIALKSFFSNFL